MNASSQSKNSIPVTPKHTAGRKVVRWTEGELKIIVEKAAILAFSNPDHVEGQTLTKYILQAQNELVLDRRKSTASIYTMMSTGNGELQAAIRTRLLELKAMGNGRFRIVKPQKELTEAKPGASKSEEVSATPAPVPEEVKAEVTSGDQGLVTTIMTSSLAAFEKQVKDLEATMGHMISGMADRFENQLRTTLSQRADKVFQEMTERIAARIANTEMADRLKVLVIGTYPKERDDILKEMSQFMDIKFVDAGESPKLVSEKSPGVEHVLYVEDRCSGAHVQKIRNSNDPVAVRGGLRDIIEGLENLYMYARGQ